MLKTLQCFSISLKIQARVLSVAQKALTYQSSHCLSETQCPSCSLLFNYTAVVALCSFHHTSASGPLHLPFFCLAFPRKPHGSFLHHLLLILLLSTCRLLLTLPHLLIHLGYCPSSLLQYKLCQDSFIICHRYSLLCIFAIQ